MIKYSSPAEESHANVIDYAPAIDPFPPRKYFLFNHLNHMIQYQDPGRHKQQDWTCADWLIPSAYNSSIEARPICQTPP